MKTVPLELSMQLKEAGYLQGSRFEWFKGAGKDEFQLCEHIENTHSPENTYISSPTADEVLDQLPAFIDEGDDRYWLQVSVIKASDDARTETWWVSYPGMGFDYLGAGESIAEAAAKCWLSLKKEGLL